VTLFSVIYQCGATWW